MPDAGSRSTGHTLALMAGELPSIASRGLVHVSLREAGELQRALLSSASSGFSSSLSSAAAARTASTKAAGRSYTPHTAIESKSAKSGPVDVNKWDSMLNKLGAKYQVPPLFLKAVMVSESAGRADAVGDQGHSVGLFQLHDHGYGAGMGDTRFDPETNADRGARGLAEAWHAGAKAGYTGEYAVRAAYNYSFNPGGGWAYQGDAVVKNYNQLLADQKQPPLPAGATGS